MEADSETSEYCTASRWEDGLVRSAFSPLLSSPLYDTIHFLSLFVWKLHPPTSIPMPQTPLGYAYGPQNNTTSAPSSSTLTRIERDTVVSWASRARNTANPVSPSVRTAEMLGWPHTPGSERIA
jgi:hypothetical protein